MGKATSGRSRCQRVHQTVAEERRAAAATAPWDHVGCVCTTSAATPAACGEDIDVPFRYPYPAPASVVVMPGKSAFNGSNAFQMSEPIGSAPKIASWTVPVARK